MDIIELLDKLDLNISRCYPTKKSIQIVKEHLEQPEKNMLPALKSYCLLYDTANMANMIITCLALNDDNLAKMILNMLRPDLQNRVKNEMLPSLMEDNFFIEECARIINNSDSADH